MIEEFIQYIKHRDPSQKGGNKKCYIKGSYALLTGSFKPDEIEKAMSIEQNLIKNGVAIVPTIEYKAIEGPSELGYYKGYILQQKAPGEELYLSPMETSPEAYTQRLTELTERPQEFYDKFASDWLQITQSGLQIDPSKSSNFFYTPERINFIDLNLMSHPCEIETSFLDASVVLFNGGMYYKSSDNRRQQTQILRKLATAFTKQGVDTNKVSEIIHKQFPEIAAAVFQKKVISIKDKGFSL